MDDDDVVDRLRGDQLGEAARFVLGLGLRALSMQFRRAFDRSCARRSGCARLEEAVVAFLDETTAALGRRLAQILRPILHPVDARAAS